MLVANSNLIGTPILSVQTADVIGLLAGSIVDPDTLKILGFFISGGLVDPESNILVTSSIREYSKEGMVIDSIEELVAADDIIKIKKVIDLNFHLLGLKVETKKGSRLGRVMDYTVTSDTFSVQQIIVKRPTLKSFIDPELTIPRSEIIEITDFKVIVRDEEKTIKERAFKEDFVPNFVNPFREMRETAGAHVEVEPPLPHDDSVTSSRTKS
ncbi:hypothetical protein IJ135_02320 [Candidatus Saccharibacteria bacterium]|nr:hypothetical protein [Candidatus Saccharibacteria bacterium]